MCYGSLTFRPSNLECFMHAFLDFFPTQQSNQPFYNMVFHKTDVNLSHGGGEGAGVRWLLLKKFKITKYCSIWSICAILCSMNGI